MACAFRHNKNLSLYTCSCVDPPSLSLSLLHACIMLSCYQCDKKAYFYEKSGNRLFCAKGHHTLYHRGWSSLLSFVNTQPSLKKRVVQHLGMKRGYEDEDDDDDDIVLTVAQLEHLPDEIIVEILMFIFPDIATDMKGTLAAFSFRETSMRMKRLIQHNLFDTVTMLGEPISSEITDAMLFLFRNVKKLYLRGGCQITEDGLSRMTGLELLEINHDRFMCDCGAITKYKCSTIQALTNLRSLTLVETMMDNECLITLTNLAELNLHDEENIDDVGLAHLSSLKKLDINECHSIRGSAFINMTQLESLSVSCCDYFSVDYLPIISKSLTTLDYVDVHDDLVIRQMTALKKLLLNGNMGGVTDEGLSRLTNLTSLNLSDNEFITGRALSSMRQLVKIDLTNNTLITAEALRPSRESIEVLVLSGSSIMPIASLSFFPKLRKIRIGQCDPTKEEEKFLHQCIEQGIDVTWWSY